jgi:hypothetical protein
MRFMGAATGHVVLQCADACKSTKQKCLTLYLTFTEGRFHTFKVQRAGA